MSTRLKWNGVRGIRQLVRQEDNGLERSHRMKETRAKVIVRVITLTSRVAVIDKNNPLQGSSMIQNSMAAISVAKKNRNYCA